MTHYTREQLQLLIAAKNREISLARRSFRRGDVQRIQRERKAYKRQLKELLRQGKGK